MWDDHSPDPSSDPDEILLQFEYLMVSAQTASMWDDEDCPPPFGATGEGIISPENAPAGPGFRGDCD
ncbi:MAG: hypothetical protein EOP88_10945 [Verrucomicrobiaceae bacterium]|nr:MAG: hypothetical protein EOP88_10945 [Verrucomicrobiaceae bacterium]